MDFIVTNNSAYLDGRKTRDDETPLGTRAVWRDYDFYIKLSKQFNKKIIALCDDWYKQFKYLKWVNYKAKEKEKVITL